MTASAGAGPWCHRGGRSFVSVFDETKEAQRMVQTMHELRPVAAPAGIEMERLVRDGGPRPGADPGQPGLLWRVVLVEIGRAHV